MVGYSSINQDITKCRRATRKVKVPKHRMNCERQENNSRAVKNMTPVLAFYCSKFLETTVQSNITHILLSPLLPILHLGPTRGNVFQSKDDTQHVTGIHLCHTNYIKTYSAKISHKYCAGESWDTLPVWNRETFVSSFLKLDTKRSTLEPKPLQQSVQFNFKIHRHLKCGTQSSCLHLDLGSTKGKCRSHLTVFLQVSGS